MKICWNMWKEKYLLYVGDAVVVWNSTEKCIDSACDMKLYNFVEIMDSNNKFGGFSVRCLKD